MGAVLVEPLDVFEVPFSRSRTHAAAVEGMLSATEMIRAPHTGVEALCDAQGREPHDKRVWASVEKTPRKVIRTMFGEALSRDPERCRRWIVLVDGEPKQLAAVKAEWLTAPGRA